MQSETDKNSIIITSDDADCAGAPSERRSYYYDDACGYEDFVDDDEKQAKTPENKSKS